MEPRQLRYFAAVAEEGSFTGAAARLDVVQSAVSNGIRKLEGSLGVQLFERSSHRVALTEAGHVLLPRAREVLASIAAAQAAIDEMKQGLRGIVQVGLVDVRDVVDLSSVLADFHVQHPNVQLHVDQGADSARLIADVRDGRADFAIAAPAEPAPPGVEFVILRDEPVVLAVAASHPLARRDQVTVAELVDQTFAAGPPETASQIILKDMFERAGLEVHIGFEVDFVPHVLTLVATGAAVAAAPESMALSYPEIRSVPIVDVDASALLVLVRPSNRTLGVAARKLMAVLTQAIAPFPPQKSRGRSA